MQPREYDEDSLVTTEFCIKVYSFRFRKVLHGHVWSCLPVTASHSSPLASSCKYSLRRLNTLPFVSPSANFLSSTVLTAQSPWHGHFDQHIWLDVRVGTDLKTAYPSILKFSIILTSPSWLVTNCHSLWAPSSLFWVTVTDFASL